MSTASAMPKHKHDGRDFKQTPEICVSALLKFVDFSGYTNILDPCAGQKPIGTVFRRNGFDIDEFDMYSPDMMFGYNFLYSTYFKKYEAIVMNSPYGLKKEFIHHGLELADTVYSLLSMQAVNFNDFSRECLDLPEYRGRIKMVPKFFMTEEYCSGMPKMGGNAQYAWFIFSKTEFEQFNIAGASFEIQIDLLRDL